MGVLRIYISGPMEGLKDYNRAAFDTAEKLLRNYGLRPWNPAKENLRDFTRREFMAFDLRWICEHADGVYMLRGWEYSTGAAAEWAAAKSINIPLEYEGTCAPSTLFGMKRQN